MSEPHANSGSTYRNDVVGARPNPVMPVPDAHDEVFAVAENVVLADTAELIRSVVQCH